jgi:hypothetical protein
MTGPTQRETRAALRALLKSARRIVELEDRLSGRKARPAKRAPKDEEPAEGTSHA